MNNLSATIPSESYDAPKIFFTIFFSLYLVISLIGTFLSSILIFLLPLILGWVAFMLLSTNIRRQDVPIYIYVGSLAVFFLISSFICGRTGDRFYFPFLFIVSNVGISLILIRRYVYSWGGYIVFYAVAAYFLMLLLSGIDLSGMAGRGAASIAMLGGCIPLYILLSQENKKIDLKPALITLIISIWAVSRSGILSSLVLLLGLLFVRFRTRKIIGGMILFFIMACLFRDALFSFIMNRPFFRNVIDYASTHDVNILESRRWIFWSNYFNNLDVFRLIFGVNVLEDPWPEGAAMDYNYHNSFIHLHLQTGLMGLITIALILFALFKFYRTNKIYFFLLLSFILRASTDFFVFFSRFDFILFFFIFYFLKNMSSSAPHIEPITVATSDNNSP